MKRPYVKVAVDWCDDVLREWASEVRERPREDVLVTPGGSMPRNAVEGGKEPPDSSMGRGITARGKPSRRFNESEEPIGYIVPGLRGTALKADEVVHFISGVDYRCAWTLRAEYGLVPDVPPDADPKTKAIHLGAYIDGRAWPASTYADRLSRALQMFAVGYMAAVEKRKFGR